MLSPICLRRFSYSSSTATSVPLRCILSIDATSYLGCLALLELVIGCDMAVNTWSHRISRAAHPIWAYPDAVSDFRSGTCLRSRIGRPGMAVYRPACLLRRQFRSAKGDETQLKTTVSFVPTCHPEICRIKVSSFVGLKLSFASLFCTHESAFLM